MSTKWDENTDIKAAFQKVYSEPINLEEEIPIRIKYIVWKDKQYLSFLIHHIIFEGVSINRFFNEFKTIIQSSFRYCRFVW